MHGVLIMIIDAENLVLGRLASYAAKQALLGEDIKIVNCEKAVITGKKKEIINRYLEKNRIGNVFKGPFFQRLPDKFVRRVIRGMLPYKQYKGKTAYKRVFCYIGMPDELKNKEVANLDSINVKKLKSYKYVHVKDISKAFNVKLE